jgi:phosphopantetheine--protein transferase-like protein
MDCEIGIDVEDITRTVDTDAVAPSVFSPAELADFREAGLEDRRDRFFSYWTLKESYIKARGMGLSLPLDAFWFELRRHVSASMRHGPMPRHSRPVALLPACADRRAHDGRCRRRASGCRAFHSPALGKTDVFDRASRHDIEIQQMMTVRGQRSGHAV